MAITGLILTVGASYALAVATWVFYLAAMNLIAHKDDMHALAKAHAYALIAVGVFLDAVLNVFVATVMFMKLPQDWLLTGRLKRYINNPSESRWRRGLAAWICRHLLDQFDPTGGHCN